ncbi:MAG: hypothetical protein II467_05875 [Bacilli bacterium]|nr:hypothetical protein [Bacilli bacterium]
MDKKQEYIFMYKDFEVFRFEADFEAKRATLLEKLEHFDKGPYLISKKDANLEYGVTKFFQRRTIPDTRRGQKEILAATGCENEFELSFKGHGLSLSNHYWFKKEGENLRYKDINFFENKWDDTFARAVLSADYEALKHASLEVPDIVTQGWATKGWIYDNGPKLYKLGIDPDHSEESLGEVLASLLARRIFKKGEVLEYELGKWGEKYASVSPTMVGENEELTHLSDVLPHSLYMLYSSRNRDKNMRAEFFEILKDYRLPELYPLFVKLTCLRSICFVHDLHFDNIALIRNVETGDYHPAPFFDLAGSFGGTTTGKSFLSNINKATYMIIYFLYSGLDPEWDYSWYDPAKLEGFEEVIRGMLSKSDFYTPQLIDNIIDVYHHQKETLDEYWENDKKK